MSDEIASLRRKQSKRVMPLIGNLIDHWECLPNDLRGDLAKEHPGFHGSVKSIIKAMEQ